MKTKIYISIALLIQVLFHQHSYAQTNTFPQTGNAGIGTITPQATLQIVPAGGNAIQIDPYGTTPGNTGTIRLMELSANGNQYAGFKAPDAIDSTDTLVWILPNSKGISGQFLSTNGAGTLSWKSQEAANENLSNLADQTAVNINLLPDGPASRDLGSAALPWNNLYFNALKFADASTQTSAFIPYTNGTGVSITSNTISLANSGVVSGSYGSASSIPVITVDATGRISSVSTATVTAAGGANTNLSNLTSTSVNQSLIPLTTNAQDLGSSSLGWKNLYATGSLYLDGTKFIDNKGAKCTMIGVTQNTQNTGANNSFTGFNAGAKNTQGYSNSFYGMAAGLVNTIGYYNDFFGASAGNANTSGNYNCFFGSSAGFSNTTGYSNCFFGREAGFSTTTGIRNCIFGKFAGHANTTGEYNAFYGYEAGYLNVDGKNNAFFGAVAGTNNTSGYQNTYIGGGADGNVEGTLINATAIGYGAYVTASYTTVLGSSLNTKWGFGHNAASGNIIDFQPALTSAKLTTAGLWTSQSDKRLKDHFEKLDRRDILDRICQLDIERWHSIRDVEMITHIGPFAQDFNRLFLTGDDTTIADTDPAGVALVGIQALNDENVKLKSQVDSLQSYLTNVKSQLVTLQSAINNPNSAMANGFAELKTINQKPETILGQNIPNPFNNSTLIPFRIPKNCHDASIMISNTSSSEVISVIPISCNEDHLSIDAGTLGSGTYSYTLYVDGKMIETKQMILVK